MKKSVLLLALVFSTAFSFSQDVKYGIRGAVNVSNLDFEPDANFVNQHRNGFAFAGFVDFGVSENSSIWTELQWSAEGGKAESLRADYIQMPIMLNISLSERLSFGFGPQAALKTWENKDLFTAVTFSGVVGAAYMITDDLFVDVRFSYGLTNILDEDITTMEAKNHVLQFGLGMKI
ncbi:MAG: PorT family protein [Winogradskyella sp.]|uniref:porin family protein n=1 Tax=Winogradskyella sp. TaxID=1883156 RepID=UPI0017C5E910|nr:PorT family protein [Winogradskyella sp.]